MDAEAVRAGLDRVLQSPEFQNSDRLCRFLRFVVETKLNGEQEQLKEFLIGKEVFDRNGEYDPRIDPIVRVEARRLRKKLDAYYEGPGSADLLRIGLPKGGYAPEFTAATAPPPVAAPIPPGRRSFAAYGIGVVALAAGAAGWMLRPASRPSQTIAVLPARWIWKGNDFPEIRHDEDLAERLCEKLSRRGDLRVVAWPAMQKYNGTAMTMRAIASELGVARLLIPAVRIESEGFRVTAYLIDAVGDRKLNVTDLRAVPLDGPARRDRAAARIADELAKVTA